MFTTTNVKLVGVKQRAGKTTSLAGQPDYAEFRFDETGDCDITTWADFGVARKMQLAGRDTEVSAIWEVRKWVQDQVKTKAPREVRTGDLVQFAFLDHGPEHPHMVDNGTWFVIGETEDDHGIFNSIPMEKFNLIQSHRS